MLKLSNFITVLNCPLIVWLMETSGKPLLVLELENGSSTQLHSLKLSRIEEASIRGFNLQKNISRHLSKDICCRAVQEGAGGEWRGDLLHHGRRVVHHLQVLQVTHCLQDRIFTSFPTF